MARDRATDTAKLVAAAAEVFRKKGYRNATIDDIAEAASISRPTVYKYINKKQHLLDLMVEEITGYMGERQRMALDSADRPGVRLRRLIDAHVDAACTNRTFYAIMLSEEVEVSPTGRQRFRSWARRVTTDFQSLLDECLAEQAQPAPIDTAIAANLILSMLTSLYRWYDPAGPTSREQLSEQIMLLIRSVTSPGLDDRRVDA